MLRFLYSYLAPREAAVVVQGHNSDVFTIQDEVFQGTVLGPPLWNVFFLKVLMTQSGNAFFGLQNSPLT